MAAELGGLVLAELLHGVRGSGGGDGHIALDGDGLELLGAHDGPEAGATGGAALVVHDGGDERHLLAGLTDAGNLGALAVAGDEGVLRLEGVLAPDIGGVFQLCLAVLDVNIDRLVRDTGHPDVIIAGKFQVGSEVAAGVSVAPAAGQRRFADDGIA